MVKRPSAARRGFTLIELLVVMALIGMLLSLAVPRYFGNVDKAKESVLRQNLALTRDAIDKFFGDHGRYPDSLDEIVARRSGHRTPCPALFSRARR